MLLVKMLLALALTKIWVVIFVLIKKMVRDRGFGFIRGDDGKELFFHRSGLNASDYDLLSEGSAVEYVVQEGPRGARAENVRPVGEGEDGGTEAPAA